MDTELIVKVVTATVAIVGAPLGLLHFLTTKRSSGYQNLKTEMELLSQSIATYEADTNLKEFLLAVRKEKISLLALGIPIPNADLERVVTYCRKAEGKVTTGDIAKAWQYRDPRAVELSFQLRGSFKAQYIVAQVYMVFCLLAAIGGAVALSFVVAKESVALVSVSLFALAFVIGINQGLFAAARIAKLEKEWT